MAQYTLNCIMVLLLQQEILPYGISQAICENILTSTDISWPGIFYAHKVIAFETSYKQHIIPVKFLNKISYLICILIYHKTKHTHADE